MLVITVTDSSSPQMKYTNTYTMTVAPVTSTMPNGAPEDRPANPADALATFTPDARPDGVPASYQIQFTPSQTSTIETLTVTGGIKLPSTISVTTTPAGGTAGRSPARYAKRARLGARGGRCRRERGGRGWTYPDQPAPSGTLHTLLQLRRAALGPVGIELRRGLTLARGPHLPMATRSRRTPRAMAARMPEPTRSAIG